MHTAQPASHSATAKFSAAFEAANRAHLSTKSNIFSGKN